MSDYAHHSGGKLKLKGDEKKKKKKSHTSTERAAARVTTSERENTLSKHGAVQRAGSKLRHEVDMDADAGGEGGENDVDEFDDEPPAPPPVQARRQLTEAERRFEETQRKRREERVAKTAKLTHKERVKDFNEKLDKLRISWTA